MGIIFSLTDARPSRMTMCMADKLFPYLLPYLPATPGMISRLTYILVGH
jgi:hypothetical protein